MTDIVQDALLPGWEDPVDAAQSTFRAVLKALSEPGITQRIASAIDSPAPLGPAATAVMLALADHDTPVWLDGATKTSAVAAYLRFHCGCGLTMNPAAAAFALMTDLSQPLDLAHFAQGSPEYPDRSTTLLIQVPALHGGPMRVMHGPGIETTRPFEVCGLPDDFSDLWRRNAARFPLGLDLQFCCGDAIIGLPRTACLRDVSPMTEVASCM